MNYKGRLSKPRKFRPLPGGLFGSSEEADRKWKERERQELAELLIELFVVHGVDQGDWFGLTVALARTHVPAFKIEKARRGPKTAWAEVDRAGLRLDVDELLSSGKATSVLHACSSLARKDPWKAKLRSSNKNPGEALRRQYQMADPRMVQIVEKGRAYDAWALRHPEEAAAFEQAEVEKFMQRK